MITGIFTGFKRITEEIYRRITANLPLYRLFCSCGHAGCLVRHGYYRRRLKTRQGTIVLCILRVKCKECRRTHAILPELVVPYSQIPADLQQYMLLYPLGSPELEALILTFWGSCQKGDSALLCRGTTCSWILLLLLMGTSGYVGYILHKITCGVYHFGGLLSSYKVSVSFPHYLLMFVRII